ncbi:hypothetical protein GH714_024620 [Hevea brasiliensis]|uniref:Plant bHLH transcription factor ACT-like domain-containing protein n=1 Tax=Hevea brasiliensis TaxID=3981 RepID=A0A6A6MHB2_HEVBR|nr:hypothetical protein GH714_024620 [Hevea brasiliensis]
MLSGLNGTVWMEDKEARDSNTNNNINNSCVVMESKQEMGSISNFKSMLDVEDDWYVTNTTIHNHHDTIRDITFSPNLAEPDNLFLHSVDSSSSCSPTSSVFNNLDPSHVHYFMHSKPTLSSLLNVVSNNPLEHGFDLGEIGFLENQATAPTTTTNASPLLNRGAGVLGSYIDFSSNNQISTSNLCSDLPFPTTCMLQLPENGPGLTGFRGSDESSGNTLFLNRSKLLRPLETFPSMGAQPTLFQKRAALRKNLGDLSGIEIDKGKRELTQLGKENERREKWMDRASILGDAIEYLKELLQRINDLHNELESTPPGSSLTPTSFHPLTPTPSTLSSRIKDKLCPSPLPSPNGQPARVEVRVREGRAVNIHMFCGRRPGLLLSTMRALDNLGIDIEQAVISCFNGFAMDIFQAEESAIQQQT